MFQPCQSEQMPETQNASCLRLAANRITLSTSATRVVRLVLT
jgi:hypothetical protein